MDKIKTCLEKNSEPCLLPAMLAFESEKTSVASPYSFASDLAEGLIISKKGLSRKRFLKQYCQGSNEMSFETDPSCTISVLVGTIDAIHKWLRMSGHARCALWIEHASLEGSNEKVITSAKLELVYRQRDYQVSHLKVLQASKLVLSLTKQLRAKQSKTKDTSEDECEFDWKGLRQRELKQLECKDENYGADRWKETTMRWYILMKVPAFKKLSNMLSPGGALWEFRRMLLQVTNLPEFLDIDFKSVNLQERLTHHPHAIFLIGCDAIMTRTTSKGIFVWKVVRFDFDQGIVTLGGGETLKGLLSCIKNDSSQKLVTQGIEDHEKAPNNKDHENQFEHANSKCCSLDWAVWRGVYRAGPMETILTSAFANEDDCMVLKSLTSFFSTWKDKDFCRCCTTSDLGAAFRECRGSINQSCTLKLSSKEWCAISELRNIKQEVRRQGLQTLLDILLDEVKDLNILNLQKITLNTTRKSRKSTPLSSRFGLDVENTPSYFQRLLNSNTNYVEEKDNVSLLLGLMVAMDRPMKRKDFQKEKKIVGSETERALQGAEMKWKRFEEMKSDRSSSIGEKTCSRTRHALRWQRMLEWVDNGFLEVLLKESMNPILEDSKVDYVVENTVYACLQVVRILPREGSYRIVNFLISKLKNLIDIFSTLKIETSKDIRKMKHIAFQQNMEKLKMSFDEMVRFGKLLALLMASSVSIASTLANQDGLFLMLNFYSIIVKDFPTDIKNLDALEHEHIIESLPGEVFRRDECSSKGLKPHTSNNVKAPWIQRQEERKAKERLPLQEVLVSSQNVHNFFDINSKISNVTYQSSDTKPQYIHVSKTKESISIDDDTTTGSFASSMQLLKPIIDIVWETKLHLLQSLVTMFESQSITLNKCKTKMREKIFVRETSTELLSWLLSDLIGGHLNIFPPHIVHKLNKLIFNIIFLLDKNLEGNILNIQCPKDSQFNFQYAEEGPWWSGPGPPLVQLSKIRLLGLMLVELKEKMDYILTSLTSLMITLPRQILRDGKKLANNKIMIEDTTKTHVHSLWINLARLITVLSDYISYWPTKEPKSQNVLRCCGGHFHQTLALLASLGPPPSWTPAQIIAMQSLLKLLSLCIEDSITTHTKENWSEYEKFLWEMVVDTWAHWNCIQSYVSWMSFEVCQGCLTCYINNFQKSFLESINLHYLALEEKLGMKRNIEDVFEKFQNLVLVPKSAMMFLHLVVLLAQQKFYTQNNNLQDGNTFLRFNNNNLWFLHEIMNPNHGLLIMTIKNKPLPKCTDCKIEITNPDCLLNVSSRIEKYSLMILAHIFNFKFFSSNVHVQESCHKGCTNVYLSKKYLIPFLHVLYTNFKNLYSKVVQQSRLDSLCTLGDAHFWEVENKGPITNHSTMSFESATSNDKNICSAMDGISNLCYLHAQVLHSIAKNLSKDGNQIFKDLCIMDFLVKEISLEYEFSQVADFEFDSKDKIATNFTFINLQKLSLKENLKVLEGLGGSNSSSNSISACRVLPNLSQDNELSSLQSICQNYMPQRSLDVNGFSQVKTSEMKKKINVMSKDVSFDDNGDTVKNVSICLSHSSIFGNVNLCSKVDKNDLKSFLETTCRKKEVVYSGRFFDLNEEVERELAEENEEEMTKEKRQESVEKSELVSCEQQAQSQNIEDASISSSSTKSRSSSSLSIKRDILATSNIRPSVPKLDFANALQNAESKMASGCDSETIDNDLKGQFSNSEDFTIGCKSSNMHVSYEKERLKRPIYHNSSLHILMLELIIYLMLDPEGTLEVYYCDRFPMEHQIINAPFYLFYHINHTKNEYILPILAQRLDAFNPSARRILKLTWQTLFDPSLYSNRVRIAQGALSQVYTASRRSIEDGVSNNELVVLKVVALPKGPREPCSFVDVFTEVQILERFRGDSRVCQILDYGVDAHAFTLVLKHYACSLRHWRRRHQPPPSPGPPASSLRQRLPLYLDVFAAVLHAVKALEAQNVVHYDLKCDNVLLEPLSSTVPKDDFWQPNWPPSDRACAIPFRVCITDFGQSKASFVKGGECTTRNRGTECVKSPEMLKMLSSSSSSNNGFGNGHGNNTVNSKNRGDACERQQGAASSSRSLEEEMISVGKAGDVWGLGCLLYELLTGEYLLYDDDWVRFFMRVTLPTEELIPNEKAAKLDNFSPIIDFLRFILVRDPNKRPSLDDLILHLQQLQAQLRKEDCRVSQPQPVPLLHESTSTAPDFFDEIASVDDMEDVVDVDDDDDDDEPQIIKLPVNVRPLRRSTAADHGGGYKRCQTPSAKMSGGMMKADRACGRGGKRRASRLWRVWCLCCACCQRKDGRRDVNMML